MQTGQDAQSPLRNPRTAWAVGLTLLLAWAVVIAVIGLRFGEDDFQVPPAVLEYEVNLARHAADSVRRSLNQGVDDLIQFSRNAEGLAAGASLEEELGVLTDVHGRYAAVYTQDAAGELTAAVGERPVSQVVPSPVTEPGMDDVFVLDDGTGVLPQYSPFGGGAVVGFYDPSFLQFPLSITQPGDAWIVDRSGRVIFGLDDARMLSELRQPQLREAAARAAQGDSGATTIGEGYSDEQVVSYAPIVGVGPSGELGWSVVSRRTAQSLPSQVADVRRLGPIAGMVLALVTLGVFAWLHATGLASHRRRQH